MRAIAREKAFTERQRRTATWRLWLLLAIAWLAWLPGLFALPALDRDESRFAQASRQMVESADYVDIRLGESSRYNKPIGIYWMQAAVSDVAGLVDRSLQNRIWVYRLPSFLSGLLCLFLVYSNTRRLVSERAGFIAAALLGLSLLLSAESEIATTDAALLLCVIAAQLTLLRVRIAHLEGHDLASRTVFVGWAALGAGILIKGPVILGVIVATIVALCIWNRDWRWLKATKPLPGAALALAVVLPWAIAIGFVTRGEFYQQSLGHDFAAKIMQAQETHGAPPGYYLALLGITFWPATLFVVPAFVAALRRRSEPMVQFLLCWAASCFLLFELVPTKLPHYILPAYPALAILVAAWLAEGENLRDARPSAIGGWVSSVLFAFGTAAIALLALLAPGYFHAAVPLWTHVAALFVMMLGGSAILFLLKERRAAAFAATATCALVLYPTLTAGVAPKLRSLWISEQAATLVTRFGRPHDPPLAVAGYAEPSLLFLLGGDTRFSTGGGAANIAVSHGGLALIEDNERVAFLARISELKALASPLDQYSGFDYSRGKAEHFVLYRVSPVPQDIGRRG